MRIYSSLFLLTILVVEATCYHYQSGLGFRRKRSPRYPNYEGTQNGGNNIPNYGGGQNGGNNRPNNGGGNFPNYGGGNFPNYGGGNFPNYGGGNFPNYGGLFGAGGGAGGLFGGGFPGFGGAFPSMDNTNFLPEGASAEGRAAGEGADVVIAESEHGNSKASGIRVGRGRIAGWGKSSTRDRSSN